MDEGQMMKKMGSVGDTLIKLQGKLQMAQLKLEWANEKMIAEHTLFDDLRGVSNDLEDIIDEALNHIDIMSTLFSKVHWYSPFIYIYHKLYIPHHISHRIRTFDSRLEEILKQKLHTGLILCDVESTDELHDTEIVVGEVEREIEKLVYLLLTDNDHRIDSYGIVGARGIGKTSLAKKIFNHSRIRDAFHSPPPVWVHVHKSYTYVTIIKFIIDKIGGHSSNADSGKELLYILWELVSDKDILIVLDDVKDSNILEDILYWPFYGGRRIKMLITTRYESVITSINSRIYKHKLSLLSPEDGWALMCKSLFRDDSEKQYMQLLEEIGKKMVSKCHGLPLSIKTIVRILNSKEKIPGEWEKVLENIIVLLEPSKTPPEFPIYFVPYENLSPYIKQCFIFCAFFPEDYIFEKSILIQQWMAAGLLHEPSTSIEEEKEETPRLLEDIVADDYYMELLESNILQHAECLYYDDKFMCRMHDNFRSFGRHLVKNGYFEGDAKALEETTSSPSSSSSIPKLHHLVITNHAPLDAFPNIVKKQTSVRTLVFTSKLEITKLPKNLFQKLKLLRILDISGSDCRSLPKSLFKLVHLRHLNLSCLPIKSLPEAIKNLINLQYLILKYCGSLVDLPESITRLHKLRSIDLHKTPLMGMPIGIRKLSHLTSLVGFAASDSENYSTLSEIHGLSELQAIDIVNLEVADVPNGKILQGHTNLINLTLSCGGEGIPYEEGEKEKMQKTFDNLSPPDTIQRIKINGYFGRQFPNWITDSTFQNMRRLDLLKCKYCEEFPLFDNFPRLEHVRIEDAWSIRSINFQFANLYRLKSLILQNMPEWAEWTGHVNLPVLESLKIINCPKLKSLPNFLLYYAKNLAALTIYKAHSLEKVEDFKSVKTATLFSNHNLSKVSGFLATCKFKIDDCPKLDVTTLFSQTSL